MAYSARYFEKGRSSGKVGPELVDGESSIFKETLTERRFLASRSKSAAAVLFPRCDLPMQ
eukprot:10857457-Heterocapsa_arctica.AAC.1